MEIAYFLFVILSCAIIEVKNTQIHSRPEYSQKCCKGNEEITSHFFPGISGGYRIVIRKKISSGTEVRVKLDAEGNLVFGNYNAKFISDKDSINNVFHFIILEDTEDFLFTISGKRYPHQPPYILSLKINGQENCKDPDLTYFDRTADLTDVTKYWSVAPNKFCGRRRINHHSTPLIVSGSGAKAGDWPWHAAIYRLKGGNLQYICGGTLLSTFLVLTAAHCATIRGVPVNPEILGVTLGKYALIGQEATNQDREVYKVIVHEDFNHKTLDNDIALLKLSSEAVFNNYVQPACLWLDEIYDQLHSYEISGTVTGWGIDQLEKLSKHLREATMPVATDVTCIRYEPLFYTNMLNGKKFCAGYNNGTAACNGDSGGGFMVFVRDAEKDYGYLLNDIPGAWYVKGIVSLTLARKDSDICDPSAYTVYTDVAKYRDWILNYMN